MVKKLDKISNILEHSKLYNHSFTTHDWKSWQIDRLLLTFSLVFKCDPQCPSPITFLKCLSVHYYSIKTTKSLENNTSKYRRRRTKILKTLQVQPSQGTTVFSASCLSGVGWIFRSWRHNRWKCLVFFLNVYIFLCASFQLSNRGGFTYCFKTCYWRVEQKENKKNKKGNTFSFRFFQKSVCVHRWFIPARQVQNSICYFTVKRVTTRKYASHIFSL